MQAKCAHTLKLLRQQQNQPFLLEMAQILQPRWEHWEHWELWSTDKLESPTLADLESNQ